MSDKGIYKILAILTALLLIGSCAAMLSAGDVSESEVNSSSSATIYVPDDYSTTQWAVDNATGGDTIIVMDGTYIENIKVDKRLTIRSENGSENCIVQAANSSDNVFEITADYVNIRGFTVTGATRAYPYYCAGIRVDNADHCSISDNFVTKNYLGIYLNSSNNNTFSNNNASNNDGGIWIGFSNNNTFMNNSANSNNDGGVYLYFSSSNTFMNNSANSNNDNGICLRYSSNNTFSNNNASNNDDGIWIGYFSNNNTFMNNSANLNNDDGVYLYYSSNNTFSNNNASNNEEGIKLDYSRSNTFSNNNANLNNWHGVHLYYSSSNTFSNNNANSNNWFGIRLSSSNNNTIANNNANSSNKNGILLYSSSNNTITNNNANSNSAEGIWLGDSSNNVITNNNASNNHFGIHLHYSCDNTIYLNNFINNTDNVYSYDSNNVWNSTEKISYTYNGNRYTNSIGNYWSDYKDKYPGAGEIGSTGIWDTPYRINSDKDNYPLIKPFETYFYGTEESSEEKPTEIQKGMSYAAWWHDTYNSTDSNISLENLNATGTEWVSLVVTWYQDNVSSTRMYRDKNRTPTDGSLINAINKIHSLNMSVMLKPTVDLQDGKWRGDIGFDNIIYSDAIDWDWQDWSWDCNRNFDSTTSVYRGKYAINASFEPWGGLSFANPEGVNTDRYDRLEFYINGGERGGQQLRLSLTDDKGNELPLYGGISINNPKYVHDGVISAKTWKLVSIPFEDLNANNTKIIKINIMDNTGHAQPALYIDDIMLTAPQSRWNAWFSSYEQFILHYANLAEKNNCEQFCVGVEYKGTVHRENSWRGIIEKVREHYTGPITYASNWDNYQNINWWDASALDFVGIDAYFPLTNKTDPTVDELKEGWKKWEEEIESWQEKVNKSIIFTEIGYRSIDGTNIKPYAFWTTGTVDLQEQADCYNATFQIFGDKTWLAGIYWWMWDTNPNIGGPLDKSYTPYKKSAGDVLKTYYLAKKQAYIQDQSISVCMKKDSMQ